MEIFFIFFQNLLSHSEIAFKQIINLENWEAYKNKQWYQMPVANALNK